MKITIEEAATLLGQKDLEIYVLQKQLFELQRRLTPPEPSQEQMQPASDD